MSSTDGVPLYAITDRRQMGADPVAAVLTLERRHPGPLLVQLREKDLSASALYQLGRRLKDAVAPTTRLLINGRPDVARSLGVGVHLPATAPLPVEVRRVLGPGPLLGYSCHSADEAWRLAHAGADLVTLSPIWESPGKGPPLGPQALSAAKARGWPAGVQLFALGGVDPDRVPSALAAGADGVAMIRGAWTTR